MRPAHWLGGKRRRGEIRKWEGHYASGREVPSRIFGRVSLVPWLGRRPKITWEETFGAYGPSWGSGNVGWPRIYRGVTLG